MPKNYCIMQIWAESGKSALPICNYSQILYQFLTFTQNLKRSRGVGIYAYLWNSNSTIHETHQILSKEKGSAFKDIKWELYPCASHIIYAHTSPYNVLSFFVFVFFYENYFMKMLS